MISRSTAAVLAVFLAAPAAEAATFLFEDFSDNSAGWTLGPEWQIGSATASSGQINGNPDPATDHTPTGDNGVAGVVIGGNVSTAQHDFYWLVSPVIDLGAALTAELEFWRWLNSDYTPYMQNRVQVYDGTLWQTVFETGPWPAVWDSAWTRQVFDVTGYANADFQVRFGFNIDSGAAWNTSGWNLDDVSLTGEVSPVPVPAALPLLGLGIAGLFGLRRRRRA